MARVPERAGGVTDTDDLVGGRIEERHHRQFDALILVRIEARRLDVCKQRGRLGKGHNFISSQYFFASDELSNISTHSIFTDDSQRWTASGGGSVTIKDGLRTLVPTVDFLYGDGLRADDPAGIVPNGGKLPSYFTANFGIAQNFDGPGVLTGLSIRCDVINAFDRTYLIRDGSGVGVGAPQYGARRGFFGGIRKAF